MNISRSFGTRSVPTIVQPAMPRTPYEIDNDRGDPDGYAQLLAAAPTSGRCPVWFHHGGLFRSEGWVPEHALARLAACDAEAELARHWPLRRNHEDGKAPFGDAFPGLLPRRLVDQAHAVRHAAALAPPWPVGDLVVVPVDRPADIPAAIGWRGMINSRDDVVGLSAVLRSWEERFGALLIGMSLSTLELAVAEPPITVQESLHVAAEHTPSAATPSTPTPGR